MVPRRFDLFLVVHLANPERGSRQAGVILCSLAVIARIAALVLVDHAILHVLPVIRLRAK